jgi:hypothetical protein
MQTTSNGCSQPPPRCTGIRGHDDSHPWYVHSSSSVVGLICATNPTKANSRGWASYMSLLSSSNTIIGPLAGLDPGCVAMLKVSLPLHSVSHPPSLSPSLLLATLHLCICLFENLVTYHKTHHFVLHCNSLCNFLLLFVHHINFNIHACFRQHYLL